MTAGKTRNCRENKKLQGNKLPRPVKGRGSLLILINIPLAKIIPLLYYSITSLIDYFVTLLLQTLLLQSGCFIDAEHDIHVLNSSAGSTFTQVVAIFR